MTAPTHLSRSAFLVAVLAVSAACSDAQPPTPPAPERGAATAAESPQSTEPVLGPEDVERELTTAEKKQQAGEAHARGIEQRRVWDEHARGYIDSFQRRVYEPYRDGRLEYLEGTVTVRADEQTAEFRLRFDGGREPGKRVSVSPDTDPDGMPPGTARTVARWANHSLRGAYRTVVYYLPPLRLGLLKSNEKGERLIVYCPPLKAGYSVSYSFDERELIMIRGANGPELKEITHFEWELVQGRYFLSRLWFFGIESEMTFSYGKHGGVVLAEQIRYRKNDTTLTLDFAYSRVDLRP